VRRLRHDRNTARTVDQNANPYERQRAATKLASALDKTKTMYLTLIVLAFASTIFTPTFIGIRARTNSNWRSL
jgi:hypothetical protein